MAQEGIHVLAAAIDDPAGAIAKLADGDGIDVTRVDSVGAAVEVFDTAGDVECVVIDHDPPAIDGVVLLEAIRTRAPNLPVVLFAEGRAATRAQAAGVTDTLSATNDPGLDRLPEVVEAIVDYYRASGTLMPPERRAETVLDAARDAISIVRDGTYVFANTRMVDLVGATSRERLVGDPFPGIVDFEGIELTDRIDAVSEGLETLTTVAGTLRRPAGDVPVEVSAQPTDWEGSPAAVVIVRDVSGLRRVERRLRNYEQAVESSSDLLAALSDDRRFLFANKAYCAYHGIDQATVEGRSLYDVLDADDASMIERHVEAALDGESVQYETVREHPERGERLLDVRYYPLRDEDGTVRGYGSTIRDITERSERLDQLQKIDRILRHNGRNALNVITGHAEMIYDGEGPPPADHARTIFETAAGLLDTFEKERRITGLLAEEPRREGFDAVTVVRGAIDDLGDQYPDVTISVSAPDSAPVVASPHLPAAVTELLGNAVGHGESGDTSVAVTVTKTGAEIAIEIADHNESIPEVEVDVLTGEGVIGPLYHGSGLGLWYVSLVVKRSGGHLVFDENEPRGNVVTMVLET